MKQFRWEEQLRRSFQEHAVPSLWCAAREPRHVCSVIESTCSDGRADWVWATIPGGWGPGVPGSAAALLEQPTCSRILAALKFDSPLRSEILHEKSGVARTTFLRYLDRLLDVELVAERGKGVFSLGAAFRIPKIEICSFEFKLENWRRAFQQARRYRSFSNRVYVVMPSRSANRALEHKEMLRRRNVGLICHDVDGVSKRLIPSLKREPSCPSDFIQAVGLLLGQVEAKPARRANSDSALAQFARCSLPVKRSKVTPSRSSSA